MIKISWTPSFKKAYKKWVGKYPEFIDDFADAILSFEHDPFTPKLKTHKLTGKLKESWAFSAGYNQRVIFDFISKKEALLKNIGTHDNVY